MKSAFVTEKQVEKYVYPEPLVSPKPGETDGFGNPLIDPIDPEVIEAASQPGEELPWVKFRVPKSRKDVDAIGDATQALLTSSPSGLGLTTERRYAHTNRTVFAILCEGWSFNDDPTAADFDVLQVWSSEWIIAAMNDAMDKGTLKQPGSEEEEKKGSDSTKRPARGRGKSRPAADPD